MASFNRSRCVACYTRPVKQERNNNYLPYNYLPFLGEQRTATSLEWLQVVLFWTQPICTWRLHRKRLFSLNTHVRLLILIGPTPSPKAALVKEVTTVVTQFDMANKIIVIQLTVCTAWKSRLPTCHSRIIEVPSIVTDSTPHVVVTDLHSSFHLISTTNQSDRPLSTSCIHKLICTYISIARSPGDTSH